MKEEIKEILDSLKDILDEPKGLDETPNGNLYEYDRSYDLEQDEIKTLLDYITNLQEENGSELIMKYVVVDIGCIECGEPSSVLGIFTDLDKAKEIVQKCEDFQEEHWCGQHNFEIFEIDKENELVDEKYIKGLESQV